MEKQGLENTTQKQSVDKETCKRKVLGIISLCAGVICIIYFVIIELFMGHGTNFYYIWLIGGLALALLGIAMLLKWSRKVPRWLRKIFSVCIAFGLILFLFVEGLILSGFRQQTEEELDYLIVLGAWLKPSGPSLVLKLRLDTAYEYLLEHEDTLVIVSGGQGSNEPSSEAQGMYDYLVKKGIAKERIIKEELSTNTNENIGNSSVFLDKQNHRVGIVTNNFHVYRAVRIAKKEGIVNVYGIAAPSYPAQLPNNMLREFFGVIKDFAFGNM